MSRNWKMIPRPKPLPSPWHQHSGADAVTRDFFDRIRQQKGATAAFRLWRDFANWMEAVEEMPTDDDTRDLDPENNENDMDMLMLKQEGERRLREFTARLAFRSVGEADEFWLVWKAWRVIAAGARRRGIANAAGDR